MVDPIKLTTTFECCTAVRMLLSSLSWNGENRICPNSPTTFSCRTQCGSHLAKFLLFFYKIFLSFYQKGFLKNKTFNLSTFYWRLKRNKNDKNLTCMERWSGYRSLRGGWRAKNRGIRSHQTQSPHFRWMRLCKFWTSSTLILFINFSALVSSLEFQNLLKNESINLKQNENNKVIF